MSRLATPHLTVPDPLAARDRVLRWAALVLLAAAVAWSFRTTIGHPHCQDQDFGAYYRAGAAVARGATPYAVDAHGPLGTYAYAPAYAFCFAPLARLDYLWACRAWMVVNWLATMAGIALCLRLALGAAWRRKAGWGMVLLAVVPVAPYFWANLRVGQVGMLMLLGCLGWAECARRGWRFAGGLLLAAACGLKLAPGLLVIYLVLRRDGRGLAGVAVGTACLFLLPAAWVGWDGTLRLHEQWLAHTTATHVPEQTYRPGNQSLLAQLARLPTVSNGHVCHSVDNLELLHRIYPFLVLFLAGGVFAWVWRGLRRNAGAASGRAEENLRLAVLLTFLTLAHPRAWRCNLVALLFPCTLLAIHVCRRRPGARVALAALAGLLVVCAWPTSGVGEAGWSVGGWVLLGKHFWGAVAVAAAGWWCAGSSRADASGSDGAGHTRRRPGACAVQKGISSSR
ncbi:MAG: DUF2029 domain-containing protein [Gemmataceae bacterium]|nr:DUF2029 domain-containing protein [Gemmataceae bacterium]